jgi:hypothetical protein
MRIKATPANHLRVSVSELWFRIAIIIAQNERNHMSDWKVTDKRRDILTDAAVNLCSLGTHALFGEKTYIYDVENDQTGETRNVRASNADELGQKIEDGDFIDKNNEED